MSETIDLKEYDGFLFLPGEDESQEFRFIKLHGEYGDLIESTAIGEKYHVAFFKQLDDGNFAFDETFEAIFGDPLCYVKNLRGSNIAGTLIKKRQGTDKWFENYLTELFESSILTEN